MNISTKGTLRICEKGHQYYKSSDCPTCPVCENIKKPNSGFFSKVGAPARRALEREKIFTLEKLAEYSEKEILALHGVGPSAIPKLKTALEAQGLSLRK